MGVAHEMEHNGVHLGKELKECSQMTGKLAHDFVDLVQKNATRYYDQSVNQAKMVEKRIEHRIAEHPLQSFLIAAGLGVLMGTIWTRR